MSRKLFKNGKILTLDADFTIADSMLIENGKVKYIGDCPCDRDHNIEDISIEDLAGKTVMPSFIDAHLHLRLAAEPYFGVDLTGCDGVLDYTALLTEYIDANPDVEVLRGFGWHDRDFDENGPDKKILDSICPNIPVVLTSDSAHSIWVNSKTLDICGIDKDTQNVGNGEICRYEDGTPSGCLKEEDCTSLVLSVIPDYSVKQYKDAFLDQIKYLNTLGYTGFFDAWLVANSNAVEAFKELARENKLNGYVRGTYFVNPNKPISSQFEVFLECRKRDNVNDLFSINTVKFFLDGVIESQTALLLEPYLDEEGNKSTHYGVQVWTQTDLNEAIIHAIKGGFQIEVHCIGDGAVEQALVAFEHAQTQGLQSSRTKISHIELIRRSQMERFSKLNLTPLLNPYWAEIDDLYFAMLKIIGEERANKIWPINSFIESGMRPSMGSDYPITEVPSPFTAIELGMTRTISKYYHPWASDYDSGIYNVQLGPDAEKASLKDMLKMATINSAYSLYLDDFTGTLEVGKNADFVIINADIMNIDDREISNIKVEDTYFKGRKIF